MTTTTPERKLVINCGASHVSLGIFTVNMDRQLVLEDFASKELHYDFSEESSWISCLLKNTKKLINQHKISGDATVILPGYQLLTKFIKVPVAEDQNQVIAYELAQELPYPLSEVVWDKHVISDDKTEQELLILAAKSEATERICALISSLGLRPTSVAASPALDYNSFCYTYPDANQDTLLINIGARDTDLTFITKKIFFVRNINWGGSIIITQNIAEELGKTFIEAEELKSKYFAGERNLNTEDPVDKIIKKSSDAFIEKLGAELFRSIVAFRRQHHGYNLQTAWLTGRGSLLPGLATSLSNKLNIQVRPFNPVQKLQIGPKLDKTLIDSLYYQMSELVGEASGQLLPGRVKLTLIPPYILKEQQLQKRKPLVLIAAALLLITSTLPWLKKSITLHALQNKIQKINAQLTPIQHLNKQILSTLEQIKTINTKTEKVENFVNSKHNWINFLVELQKQLHNVGDVWLEELHVIHDNDFENETSDQLTKTLDIRLSGCMIDRNNPVANVSPEIEHNANNLLKAFTKSDFIKEIKNRKIDNSQKGLLKFEVTLVVNPQNPLLK
jgi:type IV pilus assembly protein PilM